MPHCFEQQRAVLSRPRASNRGATPGSSLPATVVPGRVQLLWQQEFCLRRPNGFLTTQRVQPNAEAEARRRPSTTKSTCRRRQPPRSGKTSTSRSTSREDRRDTTRKKGPSSIRNPQKGPFLHSPATLGIFQRLITTLDQVYNELAPKKKRVTAYSDERPAASWSEQPDDWRQEVEKYEVLVSILKRNTALSRDIIVCPVGAQSAESKHHF